MVQTMKHILKKLCNNSPKHWSEKISDVMDTMNSTPNRTTGKSPYFVLHGYEPRLIADAAAESSLSIQDNCLDSNTKQRINEIVQKVDNHIIKENINTSHSNANCEDFLDGEAVLVRNFWKKNSFDSNFVG